MSSAIFDFADIRSRMLGDDKPMPALAPLKDVSKLVCLECDGSGWMQVYSPSPPAFDICEGCGNPEAKPCP